MTQLKHTAFEFIDAHRQEMLALWQDFVSTESPSADKPGVDAMARKIAAILSAGGADARVIEFEHAGNMVVATVGAQFPGQPVALMGHFDTVFPVGTLRQRPFTVRDGRAFGPGVLDMKGGIVILLYAIKALQAAGYASRPIKVILAGDEEIGHPRSDANAIFQREVRSCVAAFNCETGSPQDKLVVGRKGSAVYLLEVHGLAAHAGVDPENGRSAIHEIAHKVLAIQALSNPATGTTFNVGTIRGGKTFNAVPDYAAIDVDIRFVKTAAMEQSIDRLKEIAAKTFIDGTRTTVNGRINFPPMETTPAIMRLFDLAVHTAVENGFPAPTAVQSGGGSDSSNSVLAGVPTLCAMGVKGERNHAPEEYAVVESLFERCKFLIACILNLDTFS